MRKLPMNEKELEELLQRTNLKGVVSKDKLKILIKAYENLKTKRKKNERDERLRNEADFIENLLAD